MNHRGGGGASRFALALRIWMIAHSVEAEALARRLERSRATVTRWRRGHTVPSIAEREAIASYFGCADVEEFEAIVPQAPTL